MKKLLAGASFALLAACSPSSAPPAVVANAAPAIVEPAAPKPLALAAPAGEYVSDRNHSSVVAKLQHMGLAFYTMKFRTFDATVTFDPANIAASKVTAKINPADITADFPSDYIALHPGTRFKSWEDDLANSGNFLNATKFPEITFVSTSVAVTGERTAKVVGDLTFLGVTKPVTLDATFDGEVPEHMVSKTPAIGVSATGTFKRSDFGSTFGAGMLGDDIQLIIEGDFLQKKPA